MDPDNISADHAWTETLSVTDVPQRGLDVTLSADEPTRAALARANGLLALPMAEARLHVARRGREGLHVTGEVRARVAQTCVVTLEAFESDIAEPVDVEFAPAAEPKIAPARPASGKQARRAAHEIEEDEGGMDDLDGPDPIVDGRIDLGALASEFLTLGIDPYPRKPGAEFQEPTAGAGEGSPFARLAGLRKPSNDENGR